MELSLSFQNIQELCHTVGNSLGAAYQQDKNEQVWQLLVVIVFLPGVQVQTNSGLLLLKLRTPRIL